MCSQCIELQETIDALRTENRFLESHFNGALARCKHTEKERDQYKALLEELNSRIFPGSIDTADSLVLLRRERDTLEAENKLLKEHGRMSVTDKEILLVEEIHELRERVAKLKELLKQHKHDSYAYDYYGIKCEICGAVAQDDEMAMEYKNKPPEDGL